MKIKILELVGFTLLIGGITTVLYGAHQNTFWILFLSISMAFTGYLVLALCALNNFSIQQLIIAGILIRILGLFDLPALTDDFYRFYWDGWLNASSISAYLFTPREVIQNISPPLGVFGKLNSPDYYSIYPPLIQKLFHMAFVLGRGNIESFVFWAKLPLFLGEILTLVLIPKVLRALNKNEKLAKWYFFNPLITVELIGNLHYEALAITGLCLGIYGILYQKAFISVLGVSFAIGVKLIPLITLPFFLIIWPWKNKIAIFFLLFIFFSELFSSEQLIHFFNSFNLYFQKFEFNGGLYFLSREIITLIIGYNPIAYLGPALQIIFIALLVFWFYKWLKGGKRIQAGLEMIFFWIVFYYFFSTTVHPWYLGIPIFLGVFMPFRFIYFWSFLIFLSYYHYNGERYEESYWIPVIEYGGIWLLMWLEIKKRWNFKF